ncbi:MAG TPA: hypothetical protein PKC67_11930 [Kiritimatiellia bacterium]|nr:hypothetical protein [Kiritimatiellia bacterium]
MSIVHTDGAVSIGKLITRSGELAIQRPALAIKDIIGNAVAEQCINQFVFLSFQVSDFRREAALVRQRLRRIAMGLIVYEPPEKRHVLQHGVGDLDEQRLDVRQDVFGPHPGLMPSYITVIIVVMLTAAFGA